MGGKTSKNKQAEGGAKKITETPNICLGSRPTDIPVANASLHRTQSFREQHSKPRNPVARSESSISCRTTEYVPRQTFTKRIIPNMKSKAVLVAAIDFGTTYTGYGFSFKAEPEKVFGYQRGDMIQVPEKSPTVVLMTPNKEFHSFGTDAKDKYVELMRTNEHHDWYYFDKFKMKLFVREKTPLTKDMKIEDILGKPVVAIDVFAGAVRYIRDKLLVDMSKVGMEHDTDIHWVLTVPAIWNDLSKQFMREAAERGGIPSDMLTLALEPEAASLFCKKDLQLEIGHVHRYMLVDIGGGTTDITSHEIRSNGTLKELNPPTGGAFGGTTVDHAFLAMLCRIFGSDIISAFKKEHLQMYWELISSFEIKKAYFDGSGEVKLQFPFEMIRLYERKVEESLEQSFKQSTVARHIKFEKDKMLIAETLMRDFFNTAVIYIKDIMAELLEKVENIDNIILVGGFSESPYLQKVMKDHFENLILLPKGPSLAVLKGAGMYGHDPRAISSRKCKYTYGIARMVRFDSRIHKGRKPVDMGKFTFCDDAFCKHIEIGTDVSVSRPEQATAHAYYPSSADQKHAVLEVYSSTKKDPMFVDDESCNFVGLINVDIDTRGDIWNKLMVRLIFGGTELIVEVTDEKNGRVTRGSVDFLG